jgi:hypothetical protein
MLLAEFVPPPRDASEARKLVLLRLMNRLKFCSCRADILCHDEVSVEECTPKGEMRYQNTE